MKFDEFFENFVKDGLGRDVSANQANAREKGHSLAKAETRPHPHETTQGRVTR